VNKFCSLCDSTYGEEDQFCSKCGRPLSLAQDVSISVALNGMIIEDALEDGNFMTYQLQALRVALNSIRLSIRVKPDGSTEIETVNGYPVEYGPIG